MARRNQQQSANVNEATANVAEETATTGANILSMTARAAERSVEEFSNLFGGGLDAEQSVQRYTRSIEALQEWSSAIGKGYQEISREYVSWAQDQFQTNVTAFSRLMQCRTPQDLIAAQNQLFGENVALALMASRRFAEIAKAVTENAAEKITELADHTKGGNAAA